MASAPSIRISKTVTAATAKQRMLKQLVCSDAPEQALRYHGFRTIAGVDEGGRGALFGPVVAAAAVLPQRMKGVESDGLEDFQELHGAPVRQGERMCDNGPAVGYLG